MKRAINNQVSISVKQIMKVHSIITGNVFILPLPQQAKERQRKEEGLCQSGLNKGLYRGLGMSCKGTVVGARAEVFHYPVGEYKFRLYSRFCGRAAREREAHFRFLRPWLPCTHPCRPSSGFCSRFGLDAPLSCSL